MQAVPKVTENDLQAFHHKHFPHAPLPGELFVHSFDSADSHPDDEDADGLGWYGDGAKRTLTNEQIDWFRETEIFKLLRTRSQRQTEDSPDPQIEQEHRPSSSHSTLPDSFQGDRATSDHKSTKLSKKKNKNKNKKRLTTSERKHRQKEAQDVRWKAEQAARGQVDQSTEKAHSDTEMTTEHDDNDKQANTARSEAVKNAQARYFHPEGERKWAQHIEEGEDNPDFLTHRRIAREQDELKYESVELDY